jgi:hypothetical protein
MADEASKNKCIKNEAVKPVTTQPSVLSPHHSILTQSSALSPQSLSLLLLDLCTDLLDRGYHVRFRAPGRSMYPTIREGETITVKPILSKDVRKEDILLCRLEGSLIAHRVARIERSGDDAPHFILRDDTVGISYETVEAGQVLGRVVCVERNGRTVDPNSTRSRMRLAIHRAGSRLERLWFRRSAGGRRGLHPNKPGSKREM